MIDEKLFDRWVDENRDRILQTLIDLVNIDTSTPKEVDAHPGCWTTFRL